MNIVYIILSTIILSLITSVFILFNENSELLKEKLELSKNIMIQNETIKRQRLELDTYVCDIESMKAYALKEYEKAFNATKEDKTCEGRIRHLENILKSYEE